MIQTPNLIEVKPMIEDPIVIATNNREPLDLSGVGLPVESMAEYPRVPPPRHGLQPPDLKHEPLQIDLHIQSYRVSIERLERQVTELLAERLPYDRCRAEAHRLTEQAKGYFESLTAGGGASGNFEFDLEQASRMVGAERLAEILNIRYKDRGPALSEQIKDTQRQVDLARQALARAEENAPEIRKQQAEERRRREFELTPVRVLIDPLRPHEAVITLRSGQEVVRRVDSLPIEWKKLIVENSLPGKLAQ